MQENEKPLFKKPRTRYGLTANVERLRLLALADRVVDLALDNGIVVAATDVVQRLRVR